MAGLRHTARKRFGQHFLVDAAVIDAIVAAIAPKPGEALVEIGPGLGAMTAPLLARAAALTVIELDRDLAARLRKSGPALRVIEADVLTVDFLGLAASWGAASAAAAAAADAAGAPVVVPPGGSPAVPARLRVVGNLPYNISSPILFHLMGAAEVIHDQHFMLQREVVERMAAAPGGKDYGRLSVMLQWRYRIEPLLEVPPEAFEPPPRVHSAVVRMVPLPLDVRVPVAVLSELVAVAFSQRRKLLRHTLGRWMPSRGLEGGFDLQRRAEEVPVAEYVALAKRAAASGGAAPMTEGNP